MQMLRSLMYSLIALFVWMSGYSLACAQAAATFELGGIHWKIPTVYVAAQSLHANAPHSVTLQFELPGLTPVNPKDFAGVVPGDALPVLSVTMTDDQKALSGQTLLKTLMAQTETNCSWCMGDSSLGGKEYSNYPDLWDPEGPNTSSAVLNQYIKRVLTKGVPFKLYVNKTGNSTWFAACYFPGLIQMPCEVTEAFGTSITVTYKFPMDYISQAFRLGTEVQALLNIFQLSKATSSPDAIALTQPPAPCWSPTPSSPGAETVPLQVGPQLWHIPRAYAETFGSNQTQNPQVNGFQIYLKLPDLKPLGPNDPSPFLIHGFGQYISIFFTYEDTALSKYLDLKMGSDGHFTLPPFKTTDLGHNAMIDYHELFDGLNVWDVSYNKAVTSSSFPPRSFICGEFSPGENASCTFYSNEKTLLPVAGKPFAGYRLEYNYSRDYFSQIVPISQCVQHLYQQFTGEAGN